MGGTVSIVQIDYITALQIIQKHFAWLHSGQNTCALTDTCMHKRVAVAASCPIIPAGNHGVEC